MAGINNIPQRHRDAHERNRDRVVADLPPLRTRRAIAPSPHIMPPGPISVETAAPPVGPLTLNRILRHQRSTSRPQPHSQIVDQINDKNVHARSFSSGRSRGMSVMSKKAILQIQFLIIGGSIAGLACAYALGQAGHHVRVLEKADGLHQRSGGIRCPPNLTKILLEWGLHEELARTTQECRKTLFHLFESGDLMGFLEWKEDVIQETGADFLLMHYDDLQQMLYNLAISVGATVIFNSTVTSVAVDENETALVQLENGTILKADVVVGADGYKSLVREVVNGTEDDGVDSGHSMFTITVPVEAVRADPDEELSKWADRPEWPIWMAESRSMLGYPVRAGKDYCVHVYWPDEELQTEEDTEEGWDVVVPTNLIRFDGYDDKLRRLFNLSPDALRTKYVLRKQVEDWVDETGRLVLVGEAAHPQLPCASHGPSLAVEDAAVLGSLMSRLRTWEQLPQLMEAFQDLRQARCQHVHLSELNNAALVTLPPGEHRTMRNAGMRMSLLHGHKHWDDVQLREQWEEISEVFGYNAREAAEDWWIKWGSLAEHSNRMPVHEPLDLRFEVTEVSSSTWLPESRLMG